MALAGIPRLGPVLITLAVARRGQTGAGHALGKKRKDNMMVTNFLLVVTTTAVTPLKLDTSLMYAATPQKVVTENIWRGRMQGS